MQCVLQRLDPDSYWSFLLSRVLLLFFVVPIGLGFAFVIVEADRGGTWWPYLTAVVLWTAAGASVAWLRLKR